MPLSLEDLLGRVNRAIERREDCVYEVATEQNQILANVENKIWFVAAVACWFTQNTKRWAHIDVL